MTARTTARTRTTARPQATAGSSTGWWFAADRTWHRGDPPEGWYQSDDGRWLPPPTVPTVPATTTAPRGTRQGAGDPDGGAPLHLRQPTAAAASARHLAGRVGTLGGRSGRDGRGRRAAARREARDGHDAPRARGPAAGRLADHFAPPWTRVAALAVVGAIGLTVVAAVGLAAGDRSGSSRGGQAAAAAPRTSLPGSPADGAGPSAVAGSVAGGVAPADEETQSPTGSPSDPDTAPSIESATATTATTGPPAAATEPPRSPPSSTAPDGDPLAGCTPGQRATIERGSHPGSWYVERYDRDADGVFCE